MKTKNVKVRLKDIKVGRRIFTAHPLLGIDEWWVVSKPYLTTSCGLLFVESETVSLFNNKETYVRARSLGDAGIVERGINWRRSFFKRKHAEAYVNRFRNDPKFIRDWDNHMRFMNDFMNNTDVEPDENYFDYGDDNEYDEPCYHV